MTAYRSRSLNVWSFGSETQPQVGKTLNKLTSQGKG